MSEYVSYKGKYYRDMQLPLDYYGRKHLAHLRGNTGIAADPNRVKPASEKQVKAIEWWLHRANERGNNV